MRHGVKLPQDIIQFSCILVPIDSCTFRRYPRGKKGRAVILYLRILIALDDNAYKVCCRYSQFIVAWTRCEFFGFLLASLSATEKALRLGTLSDVDFNLFSPPQTELSHVM